MKTQDKEWKYWVMPEIQGNPDLETLGGLFLWLKDSDISVFLRTQGSVLMRTDKSFNINIDIDALEELVKIKKYIWR